MNRFRTTIRGTLALTLAGFVTLVAGSASAGYGRAPSAPKQPPAAIVFPVLGPVTYIDDFGAPRPGGPHQGIDILAPKRALALAAEPGKIKFWTHSATAGCMLYLYGASGTTYYYIHLNNDLTKKNDNKGKCLAGTAYAKGLKNGAKVAAGQVVGYVGDSGDADGLHPHLHFELHPNGGKAVSPYQWLQSAQHLLFASRQGTAFTLDLRGTVAAATIDTLRLKATSVSAWPMKQSQPLSLKLLVTVPSSAIVQTVKKIGKPGTAADLLEAKPGQKVQVWTGAAPTTLKAERGDELVLTASLVSLVAP